MWWLIARKSLSDRKFSVALTLVGLLISIALLFAVEHIRVQTKDNFTRTVSGVDLVVAGRTSQINVLLSSVFRIGANPNTMSWQTYEHINQQKQVMWTVPISLGDSYKGQPVVGTTPDYFKYYQYGKKQALTLQQGRIFASPYEVVIGANIAKLEGLKIGSELVISHGSGKVSFSHHEHHPFVVSGILAPTGTPVDKSLHVPLVAIEEMHRPVAPVSAFSRPKTPTKADEHEHSHEHEHDRHSHDDHKPSYIKELPDIPAGQYDLIGSPNVISAVLLKVDSPLAILTLQRDLNKYQQEAITAIIPGMALAELWQILGGLETVLQVISMLVLVASLIGLTTMMLASMNARSAEISVLRAIGASPLFIASLIQLEALFIAIMAIAGAYALLSLSIILGSDWVLAEYGVYISQQILSVNIALYATTILVLTAIVALLPALMAYKNAKQLFT